MKTNNKKEKKSIYWLIYLSLLLSGFLLVADAYDINHLNRWTAKFGISLIFTAITLLIGNGRKEGFTAAVLIWVSVIGTYLL